MGHERRALLRALGSAVAAGSLAGCSAPRRRVGTASPSADALAPGTLVAEDRSSEDAFGVRVAVSDDGTTAVVGAPLDSSGAEDAGRAYVFEAADGEQPRRTALEPAGAAEGDAFGADVAVTGDGSLALVGARGATSLNGGDGVVYAFESSDDTWRQVGRFAPTDWDRGRSWYARQFGYSISVSDDGRTALVGAPWDDNPNGPDAGAAYVFTATGGFWSQRAKLLAEDGAPERDAWDGDRLGRSVSLSGDGETALVGAYRDEQGGSAYVFERSGGAWRQRAELTSGADAATTVGWSVSLSADGTTALVGDPDAGPADRAGAAYVFETADGGWRQRATVTPDDRDAKDRVGWSVALSADGTAAVVGAESAETRSGRVSEHGFGPGAAYVLAASDGDWSVREKLAPADGEPRDKFGRTVALSGDGETALVSSRADAPDVEDAGAVRVYDV
jgi:hypothetical protein